MKRIINGVILVLAVISFSTYGAMAREPLESGQQIKIKVKGKKMLKFKVEYDTAGNPKIIDEDDGAMWEEVPRPGNAEVMSLHYENPCTVCIGSRCWKRNC